MMTKEQYFTFKSDFKIGMKIAKLTKLHRKAYYNDGFKTQAEQNEAMNKNYDEITSLKKSIVAKIKTRNWVAGKGYVETEYPSVLGDYAHHHWAYYCAKHRLKENESISYVSGELNKLSESNKGWYGIPYIKPERVYEKYVKPILEKYEKIVCTD